METLINNDLEALIQKLPPQIASPLVKRQDKEELLEIVLDLGREPEARFLREDIILSSKEISASDIQYVIERISSFGADNRAGIERTLHRISAIRNRSNKVVGLTLRVGRAVYGTIKIIDDLIFSGKSILLLGKPGVGKTTMLREVARILADDAHKRVIVVDTSNEIAGDGDIPHPSIGHARRMQVQSPSQQHAVMIEAVENHMPEVIIIDEIGTEEDAQAARTIAERGVQLVATAHGNTLENLIINPTLSDLVGGIQTVTLGDQEARRRRTQKTVQERMSAPTFDILVEIQGWSQVAVHADVSEVVDRILLRSPVMPEIRTIDHEQRVQRTSTISATHSPFESQTRTSHPTTSPNSYFEPKLANEATTHILPYGINKGKLRQAMRGTRSTVELTTDIDKADLLLTTKTFYRRRTKALQEAETKGKPVYVLRKNTSPQIEQFIHSISGGNSSRYSHGSVTSAVVEAKKAIVRVENNNSRIELSPQGSYIRRLQHQIAEEHGLSSLSAGREPQRRVIIHN